MKNRSLLAAALLLALVLASRPAQAKLFEVWGQGQIGTALGNGETHRDFFKWAQGGAAGVEAGVKLLFISVYIDYLRFFGGDTGANLVSFNLGGDGDIGLGGGLKLVLRLSGGYYLGTLDNATVMIDNIPTAYETTRGVGVRGGVGLRWVFAKVFSFGVTPQVGYHYFFGGPKEDGTNTEENSSGWDFWGLAYFRVGLGI